MATSHLHPFTNWMHHQVDRNMAGLRSKNKQHDEQSRITCNLMTPNRSYDPKSVCFSYSVQIKPHTTAILYIYM